MAEASSDYVSTGRAHAEVACARLGEPEDRAFAGPSGHHARGHLGALRHRRRRRIHRAPPTPRDATTPLARHLRSRVQRGGGLQRVQPRRGDPPRERGSLRQGTQTSSRRRRHRRGRDASRSKQTATDGLRAQAPGATPSDPLVPNDAASSCAATDDPRRETRLYSPVFRVPSFRAAPLVDLSRRPPAAPPIFAGTRNAGDELLQRMCSTIFARRPNRRSDSETRWQSRRSSVRFDRVTARCGKFSARGWPSERGDGAVNSGKGEKRRDEVPR